ncbi:hypothetical protein GCM10025886_23900 [Tetragenococcus halophilus subsp. flandriensis]|nr:hypothetical protein GCM10025886_23900 [Tetragenococcus halophilus subsp. flandriensis]
MGKGASVYFLLTLLEGKKKKGAWIVKINLSFDYFYQLNDSIFLVSY